MYNPNITLMTETINRILLLAQAQQAVLQAATDELTALIANTKIAAYHETVAILQNELEAEYG